MLTIFQKIITDEEHYLLLVVRTSFETYKCTLVILVSIRTLTRSKNNLNLQCIRHKIKDCHMDPPLHLYEP